jgi:hypothetical protein
MRLLVCLQGGFAPCTPTGRGDARCCVSTAPARIHPHGGCVAAIQVWAPCLRASPGSYRRDGGMRHCPSREDRPTCGWSGGQPALQRADTGRERQRDGRWAAGAWLPRSRQLRRPDWSARTGRYLPLSASSGGAGAEPPANTRAAFAAPTRNGARGRAHRSNRKPGTDMVPGS